MALEDFLLKQALGKGSFGSVVKCVRKSDGEVYAMKQIKIQKLKEKDKKNALNEIRFLASIEDPYIIAYKEAFYDEPSETLCIVMEYANDSDLQSKIKKAIAQKARITQALIWRVTYQVLEGLQKLHEANIIHRDIKPANIFFHNGGAKIGDLNVAKHLVDSFAVTQTGTPYYASPEVWNEEPYDFKSDIWSLGCVLYEMAMLKPPFRAETPDKLYKKIMLGEYEKISSPYSSELSNFISKIMTQNQKKRPSISELLCYPKMMDMKHEESQSFTSDERLLKTIKFPTNMKNLNEHLPAPKYLKANTSKNIPVSPKTELRNVKSVKHIILVNSLKSAVSEKNLKPELRSQQESKEESSIARKPKILNRNGSQKLIF